MSDRDAAGPWLGMLERVLSWYPRSFPGPLAADLVESFRVAFAERRRARGPWAAVRLGVTTVAAATWGCGAEWWAQVRGRSTDDRGGGMGQAIVQDVVLFVRQLRRRPGFAVVVVVTLALGIGLNTAVFSVVRGVLLSPLPYPHADRLVYVDGGGASSLPNLEDLRERMAALDLVAGMFVPHSATLTGSGDPAQVTVSFVTSDFFGLVGGLPAAGRWLTREDDGGLRVVLSHSLWRTRYGGDPGVVGRTVVLDEDPFEVVGVARPDIEPPFAVDVWAALPWPAGPDSYRSCRACRSVEVYGRLAEGADLDRAREQLAGEWERLKADHPEANGRWRVGLVELRGYITGDERAPLRTLFLASSILLLIAALNVANVFLSRLDGRRHELAVRTALGAGRWRLLRQAWTEALGVSLLGGALGVVLASGALAVAVGRFGASLSRAGAVSVDGMVLLFGLAMVLTTAAVVAAAMVVGWGDATPGAALRDAGRSVVRRTGTLRRVLVVGEVAMAVVLTVGLGLLLRSFQEVQRVELGLDPEGVLTAALSELPSSRYPDAEARGAFLDQMQRRLDRLPGVEGAAVASRLPLGGCCGNWAWNRVDDPEREERLVEVRWVSPSYFATLGIPLRAGSSFDAERLGDPRVAVVNDEMAARLFDGEDAVGQSLTDGRTTVRIVGVSASVREYAPERAAPPMIYLSTEQAPLARPILVLRTGGSAEAMVPALREALRELDPLLPLDQVQPLTDVVAGYTADRRMTTFLMGVLGALALALGAVGIYGVVSHAVHERMREIGIRLALGATPGAVGTGVLRQALVLLAPGFVIGGAVALSARRLIASQLYEVSPLDPWVYGTVMAVFVATALVAAMEPARRATRVDAVDMLRDG